MCGFVGEVSNSSNPPRDLEILERLNSLVIHRGPDSSGTKQLGQSSFAHRRLSILDLSNNAAQPMVDKQHQLSMVFNGEIYNYKEIRNELSNLGHVFTGNGDTEVLLKSYVEWGDQCVHHLNGMYSFGIYDHKKNLFVAFRDRMGQKPFFYVVTETALIFSSELRPIMEHPSVSKQLEHSSVAHFLIYESFPHSTTPIKNVQKLEPGTQLIYSIRDHEVKLTKYWKCRPDDALSTELSKASDETLIARATSTLEKAVSRHLRSDVPLGIYLSGGIDSSLLLKTTAKFIQPSDIQTFTIGSCNDSYDESSLSRQTANSVGTAHCEVFPTQSEQCSSVLQLIKSLDEPISDLGLLASFEVAKLASTRVKVVFSGDGGDELFFGYEPFIKWKIAKLFATLPRKIKENIILSIVNKLPADFEYMSFQAKAKIFFRGLLHPEFSRNITWYSGYDLDDALGILEHDYRQHLIQKNDDKIAIVYEFLYQLHKDTVGFDDLTRLAIEYQKTYLPNLICSHTDKASMAFSIEARSPFLDNDVVEFANALPENAKLRGGRGKWILRQCLSKNPAFHHIFNKSKQGYTVPLGLWLKNDLLDFSEHYLSSRYLSAGKIFKQKEIEKLWSEHKQGRRNNTKKLWPIIVLNYWLENNSIEV
jgi:asparagine synthase (glutamine-hydrolysing)